MSARASKLSSSVGLEAPTTNANASQFTLVLTSHDGGNHVTATVPLTGIVAGITASACRLKCYHSKQEEFHAI